MTIYDPDFPDGSPECLSPRLGSTATSSSASEAQARDYFSQPIRRHHHGDRSSPRSPGQQRQLSSAAKTLVSTSPPLKGKDCLPPTPGDVISITPSAPTSTKCDTPYSEEFETPLSLSEFTSFNDRMGSLDTIFGCPDAQGSSDKGRLGGVPWNEMPQFIRRHNRELERREKEREKVIAKDKAVKEVKRQEKMTVTEARLVAGEWKLMKDIPPTLELIQRAGREEEKRMCVRIDGSVELTGIGFLRDLPPAEQRRVLTERSELDRWLRGEVKKKPKFLLDELEAYEKRLKEKECLPLEGGKIELTIEAPLAPPLAVVVTPAQLEAGKLASVAEVDEPVAAAADNPVVRRPASPAGT